MGNLKVGYIDSEICFCPYCGERLAVISLIDETTCEKCGKSFCVIEG